MKEAQLNQATAELVQWLTQQAQGAVAFGQAEIPELVQQLLQYKMAVSLIGAILGLVIPIGTIILMYWVWFKENRLDSIDKPFYTVISMTLTGSYLFLGVINSDWLQIWLAPKLFLLEYAKTLI